MSDNPLFYTSIRPVDREAHRELGLVLDRPYAFAAASHLIPALFDEFAMACASLPVVFIAGADGFTPAFLTGPRPRHNSFVDGAGRWTASYVPAYLRRYPFIVGETAGGGEALICIDERADCLASGAATPSTLAFFDEAGMETPALKERMKLAVDYAAAAKATQAATKRLADLDILRSITIETKDAQGTRSAIHGLFAVDEAAFNALPDETFLALRKDNLLGAIYMHLVSLRALDRLPAVSDQAAA